MKKVQNIIGDCLDVINNIDDNSIDLIVTSPPYADARKKEYGGPLASTYVEWFLPRSAQFKRILKPTGTFILNIKEKVIKSERHTYVIELILSMRKQGWLWTEEWCWHKKNCFPGKWSNRFRDSWERCLQFNVQHIFKMRQESVMVPVGEWAENRLKHLSKDDMIRMNSGSGSNFGKKISNWIDRDLVYPTNVLHLATECSNKKHPAPFPKSLPVFFIKLFTDKDDTVLDPFQGSGTTGVAAVELGRRYIGIDIKKEYVDLAIIEQQKNMKNKMRRFY